MNIAFHTLRPHFLHLGSNVGVNSQGKIRSSVSKIILYGLYINTAAQSHISVGVTKVVESSFWCSDFLYNSFVAIVNSSKLNFKRQLVQKRFKQTLSGRRGAVRTATLATPFSSVFLCFFKSKLRTLPTEGEELAAVGTSDDVAVIGFCAAGDLRQLLLSQFEFLIAHCKTPLFCFRFSSFHYVLLYAKRGKR